MGHPEIPEDHFLGVPPLLMGDNDQRSSSELTESSENSGIVTKRPVSMKLHKIPEEGLDIVGCFWPVNMAR
jgi:hypothetical protein